MVLEEVEGTNSTHIAYKESTRKTKMAEKPGIE
jgi:hypothetical protein